VAVKKLESPVKTNINQHIWSDKKPVLYPDESSSQEYAKAVPLGELL